jgi:putative ABC transport system permease protein
MSVLLRIAFRNLLQARRRSFLLSLAVGLVTMLLVLLLSISQGIEDNLVKAATTVSAGHVVVAGFFKPTSGSAIPIVTHVSDVRKVVEENTPGVDYIVERGRGWAKVVSDTGSTQCGLNGVEIANESHFLDTIQLAEEREYKDGGRAEVVGDPKKLAEPHTVMLFAGQAKRLGVGVGDAVTLQTETASGQTNTIDATVVAVAKDLGLLTSFAAFVPKSDIQELYRLSPDTTGALWIYLKDIGQADTVMRHLRDVFTANKTPILDYQPVPFFFKFETVAGEDWTGQKLDVTTWRDEVSYITWVLTAFDGLSWMLTVVLVIIIAVGIMNTMWNAVRERTREIGTMRAIGMSRLRVLAMIVLEAMLLGLFATTMGALTGSAIAVAVNAGHVAVPIDAMKAILLSETLRLSIKPGTLVLAVVFLSLFTALAALWPAIVAARLRPVTAIAHAE